MAGATKPKKRNSPQSTPKSMTRAADAQARITLPQSFANATVIIDQIDDTELRIRRKKVAPAAAYGPEYGVPPLSKRDQEFLVKMLDKPARANAALRRLLSNQKENNV